MLRSPHIIRGQTVRLVVGDLLDEVPSTGGEAGHRVGSGYVLQQWTLRWAVVQTYHELVVQVLVLLFLASAADLARRQALLGQLGFSHSVRIGPRHRPSAHLRVSVAVHSQCEDDAPAVPREDLQSAAQRPHALHTPHTSGPGPSQTQGALPLPRSCP